MARINKKSRIKGLPPKVLLNKIDCKLKNTNIFFDDLSTVNFVSSTINLGSQVSDSILNQRYYQSFGQDISSSLTGSGFIRKDISDSFINYYTSGVISPYVDYNNFAADGKSTNSSYYSTGSIVSEAGEGFDEPLWSKDKIEIDISSRFVSTHKTYISYSNTQSMTPNSEHFGKHYNMCYYNFANKCWDGIGTGVPFGNTSLYPYSTIGFNPGLINFRRAALFSNPKAPYSITASFEQMSAAGNPTTTFGFPFHPKFHATSSQIYTINEEIAGPFLAEKVVIYLSAAFSYYPEIYTTSSYFDPNFVTELIMTTVPACINNIFLLNQIKSSPLKYFSNSHLTASYPSNILLTATSDYEIVESSRDLLTWGGITSFGNNMPTSASRGSGSYKATDAQEPLPRTENPKELMTRDFNFSSSLDVVDNLVNLSWTGSIKLELSIKNPIKLEGNRNMGRIDFGGASSATTIAKTLKAEAGTKNGFSMIKPSGRDLNSPITVLDLIEDNEEETVSTVLIPKNSYSKNNPYILFPGDQLVLGWQQPIMSNQINSGSDPITNDTFNMKIGNLSEISFLPGEAKMIIYGSYIKEGKEYHKSSNQILESNTIHQVIGE